MEQKKQDFIQNYQIICEILKLIKRLLRNYEYDIQRNLICLTVVLNIILHLFQLLRL